MDDTENYLNSILQKRANAVPNPYASKSRTIKQPDNITRVPIVQEKEEDMPTVFRKKVGTVLNDARSSYSQSSAWVDRTSQYNHEAPNKVKASDSQHRVEYMLVTKRVEMRQNEEDDPVLKGQSQPIKLVQLPQRSQQPVTQTVKQAVQSQTMSTMSDRKRKRIFGKTQS